MTGGLTAPFKWTDERNEKVRKLHVQGLTASQAAAMMGENLSRSAVIGKWHRMGLRREPHDVTKRQSEGASGRRKKPSQGKLKSRANPPSLSCDPVHFSGEPVTVGRPLHMIPDCSCRYPVASDDTDHLMCGRRGYPWCDQHHPIVYRPLR